MIISNGQVGNTCGFFALAFIYGRICHDQRFGKMAGDAVKNAIFGSRSHIGEIFSLEALYDEWMFQFDCYTRHYGYVAEIVDISCGADVLKYLNRKSFVVLPVWNGSEMPSFGVLYGTPDCYFYKTGAGRKRKNVSPYELCYRHAKVGISFDFSSFPFGGKRAVNETWSQYILRKIEHFRNSKLSRSLRACENMAALYLLEDPVFPIKLKGRCLCIQKKEA